MTSEPRARFDLATLSAAGVNLLPRLVRRVGRHFPPSISPRPRVGLARAGAMRRMRPVSPNWGYDRGLPIDRWYIERFLRRFAGSDGYIEGDIRGVVMEVGGDEYALAYGRAVERIEVLHADGSNPAGTIVGDLVSGEGIPRDAYDCVICTETLHLLYDIHAAVRTLHDTLKPGGVALVTIPSLSRSEAEERTRWGDYWRVTSLAAARLFGDVFGPENVHVEPYGNLLAALGFLQGLAAEELAVWELEMRDPEFEVGIGVRARRTAA